MLKQWVRVKNKPLKLKESKRTSKMKRVRLLENKLRSNSKKRKRKVNNKNPLQLRKKRY